MWAATVRARPRERVAICRALLATLLFAALATPAEAQPVSRRPAAGGSDGERTYPIDSARSRADFMLRVAWLRRIEGSFAEIDGEVAIDTARKRFDVDVRIPAHRLTMDNPSHVAWAQSEEFFDVARYPWIQFSAYGVPLHVLHEGGELHGELMLRGMRGTQRLQIEPAGCARPGIGCPVRARADIRRSEFGMTSRRVVVSDRVRLDLVLWLQP